GEELRLVRGGAPVGVLERDHLALLCEAQSALDRSSRLGCDCPASRCASAAHRATAPMKERDRHAALPAEAREPDLSLGELPVGGEKAAVLVRIGVADHDFEHTALRPD